MNKIADVRERFGITQAALYRKLEWKQSRLSSYEGGKRALRLSDARQIVWALNSLGASVGFDEVFPVDKNQLGRSEAQCSRATQE